MIFNLCLLLSARLLTSVFFIWISALLPEKKEKTQLWTLFAQAIALLEEENIWKMWLFKFICFVNNCVFIFSCNCRWHLEQPSQIMIYGPVFVDSFISSTLFYCFVLILGRLENWRMETWAILRDSSDSEYFLCLPKTRLVFVLVCPVCFAVWTENISLLLKLSHCNKRKIQFVINYLSQYICLLYKGAERLCLQRNGFVFSWDSKVIFSGFCKNRSFFELFNFSKKIKNKQTKQTKNKKTR